MIVRTYTAELTGPAVTTGDVSVRPVRRLRAWTASVSTRWVALSLKRGHARPASLAVSREGSPPELVAVRSPEAPVLGGLQAVATLFGLAARRGAP